MPESAIKRYLPYTDKKGFDVSLADYAKIPNRFLGTSSSKESQFERPFLGPGYRQMHLAPPLTVAAPPTQDLAFNTPGLPPWRFSPWTPWPPWPKVPSPRPLPSPWVPPREGSSRWLKFTVLFPPPSCEISLWPNSGGCVGSGEEFDIDIDIDGVFSSPGTAIITTSGEGEVSTTSPQRNVGGFSSTGEMGDVAGVSVICAEVDMTYLKSHSFEFRSGTRPMWSKQSMGFVLVGATKIPPLWRNEKIEEAQITLDCGCDQFENCDADVCVACNYTVDEGTTPQTIGADDNVTVSFVPAENCLESSTFSWSIEYPGTPSQYGKGFSVDAATTGSPSVGITTVSGDGVAFVVMEDECGNTAKYELRCTAGNWKLCVNNLTGTCTDSEYCDPTDYLVVTIDLHETGAAGENHWSQIYSECRNCEYPACRGGSPECESRTCSAPWFTKVVGCACDYLLRKLWYWGR